jgi:hypothetical protein
MNFLTIILFFQIIRYSNYRPITTFTYINFKDNYYNVYYHTGNFSKVFRIDVLFWILKLFSKIYIINITENKLKNNNNIIFGYIISYVLLIKIFLTLKSKIQDFL